MGKLKFVTIFVSLFAALALPAAAQQSSSGTVPQKGAPHKAAPIQRGPVTGARPNTQQAVRPSTQQAVRPGTQQAVRPGAQQQGVRTGAGAAGYAGRGPQGGVQGGNAAYRHGYAGRPGFARRSYGGRYYRGSLAWEGGRWRHEWRNGRYGWWWDVGGAWYFYDQPTEGPPAFISDVEALEDPDAMAVEGPPPDEVPPPGAYAPAPVVVAPAPVVVVPPPIVCVGPLCVR